MEPTFLISITDSVIKTITSLARVSKKSYNIAPQCHRVPSDSLFECLLVRVTWRMHCNKFLCRVGHVGVCQASDDMLAANIDNVQEAHDSAVDGVKFYVTSLKKDHELFHECAVV